MGILEFMPIIPMMRPVRFLEVGVGAELSFFFSSYSLALGDIRMVWVV